MVCEYTQTLNKKGLAASKIFPKGTIMIAIVGGTIGNLGVLGIDMCFPDSIVGVKPTKYTQQKYILTLLRHYQPTIQKLAYQMAGQPNIKLPTLTDLICALPPLKEQEEIVRRVEAKSALCDVLEAEIQQAEQHAQTLSSAILQEFFGHAEGAE
jgi:type I restriction enzyme S subunit